MLCYIWINVKTTLLCLFLFIWLTDDVVRLKRGRKNGGVSGNSKETVKRCWNYVFEQKTLLGIQFMVQILQRTSFPWVGGERKLQRLQTTSIKFYHCVLFTLKDRVPWEGWWLTDCTTTFVRVSPFALIFSDILICLD